jgi:hypothetical protein
MLQSDSRPIGPVESMDAQASAARPQAYAAPQLVPLGQASDLVQGTLLGGLYIDFVNNYYRNAL